MFSPVLLGQPVTHAEIFLQLKQDKTEVLNFFPASGVFSRRGHPHWGAVTRPISSSVFVPMVVVAGPGV